MRLRVGLAAVFATCVLDPGLALAQGLKHHLVVCSGDPDPVPGTGGNFIGFDQVSANSSGDVAFLAQIDGGTSPEGVFVANPDPAPIAVAGQTAPSTGGGTFEEGQLGGVHIDDAGGVRFQSGILTGGSVQSGLFGWTGGTLTALVLAGDAAPGGGVYSSVGVLTVHSSGNVMAFTGTVAGAQGLYTDSGGLQQARVLAGDPTPAGGTYYNLLPYGLNAAEDLVFWSLVDSGGGFFRAVFLDQGGTQTTVALQGDSAPATGGGTFHSFRDIHLDDTGGVTFQAIIEGGDDPRGIFHKPLGGSIVPLVLPGDPAPNGTFGQITDGPAGNGSGRLAYRATVQGPISGGYVGVFQHDAGQSTLAAVNLWGAQGSKGGSLMLPTIGPLAVASSGEIAFDASIDGGNRCGIPSLGGLGAALYLAGPQSVPSMPAAFFAALLVALTASGALLLVRRRRYGR